MRFALKPKIVKYRDLLHSEIGCIFKEDEGIEIEKLDSKGENMFFRIALKAGVKLDKTRCNFMKEIVLYKGSVSESVSKKTLEIYEKLVIPRGVTHSIYANEDSIIYCQLNKPIN